MAGTQLCHLGLQVLWELLSETPLYSPLAPCVSTPATVAGSPRLGCGSRASLLMEADDTLLQDQRFGDVMPHTAQG